MRKTVLALTITAAVACGAALASSRLADGSISVPLPRHWHGGVNFGQSPQGPAAWLVFGNFRFHYRRQESVPTPPPHKVLITIGDFPSAPGHWKHVKRLRLPHTSTRDVSWHVIWKHRALYLAARFGSRQTATTRRLVNRRLASVHPLR